MSDAAQFEPLNHEVFQKPFPVQPAFEMWPTPENYRRSPAGKELPPKIKVWRVQNSGKSYGSVVSVGAGCADSPDAEVLAEGYNTGKNYGDVGIGRHASFLQWGYSSPPSQMTDAGRALFLKRPPPKKDRPNGAAQVSDRKRPATSGRPATRNH